MFQLTNIRYWQKRFRSSEREWSQPSSETPDQHNSVHQPPVVVVVAAATVVEVAPDFATVVVVPPPNSDATMSDNFAADSGKGI
jgi:hypothetical protein